MAWPHIDCLLHLPLSLFTPEKAETLRELLLPTTATAVSCLQQNHHVDASRLVDPYNRRKFCLANLGVDVSRFLGVEGASGLRAGLSAGVCLPETCTSQDLSGLASALCAVPSCALLGEQDLVAACGNAQLVLCGPINRLKFEHTITLDCIRDAPADILEDVVKRTWLELKGSALEAKLREYMNPFSSPPSAETRQTPLLEQKKEPHTSAILSAEERRLLEEKRRLVSDTTLSFEQMRSLLDCGAGSFRSLRGQMLSGHELQQFGQYDECGRDADDFEGDGDGGDHYCFVRYMGMLGQGRCVPKSCHARELGELLHIPCGFNDPDSKSDANESPFSGRSCLDFLNLIPLDICLATQSFGCGRPGLVSKASRSGIFNFNDTFANALIHPSADQFLQLRAFVQSAVSPLVSPLITSSFEVATRHGVASTAKVGASLKTVEAHCNYDSHSLASNVGLTLPLLLSASFFVILPLLAFLKKAFLIKTNKPTWISHDEAQAPPSPPPQTITAIAVHRSSKLLSCFDITENFKSFLRGGMNVRQGEFPHLGGMRVMSMIWIIVGHTFTSALFGTMIRNLKGTFSLAQMFDFQLIMSGVFAVDSFFFFSGFLLAAFGVQRMYKTLDQQLLLSTTSLDKPQPKTLEFYIYASFFLRNLLHRYLRLAGIYFFLLALWIFLVPHIASGPLAPILIHFVLDGTTGGCRANWWTNLLFVNNLFPYDGLPDCMGWSWYLANDFQFFIISLLLILIRHKTARGFRVSVGLIFVASYISAAVMILQNNVRVSRVGLSFSNEATQNDFMEPLLNDQHFYFRPWFRVPPYLIGLLFGLFYRNSNFKNYVARYLNARRKQPVMNASLLKESELTPSQHLTTPILTLPPHALSDAMLGGIASQDDEPSQEQESSDTSRWSDKSALVEEDDLIADPKRTIFVHLCVFTVMLILVFIPYLANNQTDNSAVMDAFSQLWWPRWLDVLYSIFSRSIWAICIGWFIISLACARSSSEKGGVKFNDFATRFARRILSLRILSFSSGLVYAVYLIHPGVQQVFYAADRSAIRLARTSAYASSIGWTVVSFALAFPCVVMIEIALVKVASLFGL